MSRDDSRPYSHTDRLGSTLALTEGVARPLPIYDLFGTMTVKEASTNALQFTAREHDATGKLTMPWFVLDSRFSNGWILLGPPIAERQRKGN